MATTSPTLEQIWQRYDEDERRLTAGISERMIVLAELKAGHHVLDIATGRGEPAIPAARKVAPTGTVCGVDITDSMLQMCAQRAQRECIQNLNLICLNAESLTGMHDLHFDACLARWGLMYMQQPLAALREIRRTLKPQGLFVAAFWAEPERVSYYSLGRQALLPYKSLPPHEWQAPGHPAPITFRYAQVDTIAADYQEAGLSIRSIEELTTPVMEASDDEALIAWIRAFGLWRLVNDLPEDIQAQWEKDVIQAAQPFRGAQGYQLGGVTRLVVATR